MSKTKLKNGIALALFVLLLVPTGNACEMICGGSTVSCSGCVQLPGNTIQCDGVVYRCVNGEIEMDQ